MGLFRRNVEARSITPGEMIAMVNERRLQSSTPPVDTRTALTLSAVWASIRLLAGVGSTLPLDVHRSGSSNVSSIMATPSLFVQPDPHLSLSSWLYALWTSLLTAGNAYGIVTASNGTGYPTSLELLDPSTVTWRSHSDEWEVTVNEKPMRRWPDGPLWHVPLFVYPGKPYGLSPIQNAKLSIGAGLSAERFGAQFFDSGGNPNALIYSEQELSAEQAQGIKRAFTRATTNNREPAVLGAGLKYERIQIAPDESQFLETGRFTVEQVARMYGIPPELIGGTSSGSSVTYANREQRAADWLTFGLMPYLVAIEEALSGLLPPGQRVKFNVDGLLRADLSTRYAAHASAIRAGWMSVNEARIIEDMPPINDGNEYLWPPYRAFPIDGDGDPAQAPPAPDAGTQ
jgi:HK97 family phage portal protein